MTTDTVPKPGANWADAAENWADVPPSQQGDRIEKQDKNTRSVVTKEMHDQLLYTVTRIYKKELVRIPKTVADRRKWKKFGEKISNKSSGGNAAIISAGEVEMQFVSARQQEQLQMSGAPTGQVGNVVSCRHCKGNHWSAQCPNKEIMEQINGESGNPSAAIQDDSEYTAAGVKKYKLPSSMVGAAAQDRPNLFTVRLSNLPEETSEADLYEVMSQEILLRSGFSRPKRIYVPLQKGPNSKLCKGWAYISFDQEYCAQKAIELLDHHRYGNMILHADWAAQKRP